MSLFENGFPTRLFLHVLIGMLILATTANFSLPVEGQDTGNPAEQPAPLGSDRSS